MSWILYEYLPVPAMWKFIVYILFSESNKYRREIDVTVLL